MPRRFPTEAGRTCSYASSRRATPLACSPALCVNAYRPAYGWRESGARFADLGDEVRDLGEPLLGARRQAVGAHLQDEVRGDRDQVGVPGALAVAVHHALHLERAVLDRDQRVGHRASGVVVHVDADLRLRRPRDDIVHDPRDVRRKHPAVRVAEHRSLRPRLLRGLQHVHRVRRVAPIAVEEVLRVEEDPAVLRAQERDRVAHHRDAFVQVRAEHLGDVHVPRLADDADDLRPGLQQLPEDGAVLRALARLPRHAERRERRVLQRLLRRELEELGVAGVRARPASLDERHPELVDLVEDPHAILDGVRQAGLLRAVAERRVVQLDLAAGRLPSLMRSPAPRRGRRRRRWSSPSPPRASTPSSCTRTGCPRATRAAAPSSPSCASSIWTAPIAASGLMVPFPT